MQRTMQLRKPNPAAPNGNGDGLQHKQPAISAKPPSEGIMHSTRGPEEHSNRWGANNAQSAPSKSSGAPT